MATIIYYVQLYWFSWADDYPMTWLLVNLMVFDIVTGTAVAIKDRELDSSVSADGMWRKVAMLMAVFLAHMIQPYMAGVPARAMAATFFCAPEGYSVLENLDNLGAPIPPFLRQFFNRMENSEPPAKS